MPAILNLFNIINNIDNMNIDSPSEISRHITEYYDLKNEYHSHLLNDGNKARQFTIFIKEGEDFVTDYPLLFTEDDGKLIIKVVDDMSSKNVTFEKQILIPDVINLIDRLKYITNIEKDSQISFIRWSINNEILDLKKKNIENVVQFEKSVIDKEIYDMINNEIDERFNTIHEYYDRYKTNENHVEFKFLKDKIENMHEEQIRKLNILNTIQFNTTYLDTGNRTDSEKIYEKYALNKLLYQDGTNLRKGNLAQYISDTSETILLILLSDVDMDHIQGFDMRDKEVKTYDRVSIKPVLSLNDRLNHLYNKNTLFNVPKKIYESQLAAIISGNIKSDDDLELIISSDLESDGEGPDGEGPDGEEYTVTNTLDSNKYLGFSGEYDIQSTAQKKVKPKQSKSKQSKSKQSKSKKSAKSAKVDKKYAKLVNLFDQNDIFIINSEGQCNEPGENVNEKISGEHKYQFGEHIEWRDYLSDDNFLDSPFRSGKYKFLSVYHYIEYKRYRSHTYEGAKKTQYDQWGLKYRHDGEWGNLTKHQIDAIGEKLDYPAPPEVQYVYTHAGEKRKSKILLNWIEYIRLRGMYYKFKNKDDNKYRGVLIQTGKSLLQTEEGLNNYLLMILRNYIIEGTDNTLFKEIISTTCFNRSMSGTAKRPKCEDDTNQCQWDDGKCIDDSDSESAADSDSESSTSSDSESSTSSDSESSTGSDSD